MNKYLLLCLIVISVSLESNLQAHNGRRFEIVIENDQLFAQGYLSGSDPTDDGGGVVRPYYNALHDHFDNRKSGLGAIASLPGFDLFDTSGLFGFDLTLSLTDAGKWTDPLNNTHGGGHDGGHMGTPMLSPLDANETIYVGFGDQDTDTDQLGSLLLVDNIAGQVSDIDLDYDIGLYPDNVLYYLQWELSTNAPGINASAPIYTIFSPDKADPVNSPNGPLHHQALALESFLGTPVSTPEPNAAAILMLGTLGWCSRRKR